MIIIMKKDKSQEIIDRYLELTAYCDTQWKKACRSNPECFKCKKGCSTCCELQSINLIEAYRCAVYLKSHPIRKINSDGRCVFCINDTCAVYEVRPLICRTHGLLLKSKEFAHAISPSCPFNFETAEYDLLDPACILDSDLITGNLVRLNLALCIALNEESLGGKRFQLGDIARGKFPGVLKPLLK
jgi:uncharacterized protein